ncbi:MAG: DUF2318 domain-containing protein [Oscillospiraceae bacterium]|jgi:uncharacterized membrane protein|nr:DUF2318 domain-containing protein [Oscillospiraceae bacterium]
MLRKIFAIISIAALALSLLASCAAQNNEELSKNLASKASSVAPVQQIKAGESLSIPLAGLSEYASIFPVEVDGTTMEVIAVKASDGSLRTAFNTCQVCYGSGKGYYKQEGSKLVCQNCGNSFTMDQVGVVAGGCNPWPITAEERTATDDTLSISYDVLAAAKQIFANWKV